MPQTTPTHFAALTEHGAGFGPPEQGNTIARHLDEIPRGYPMSDDETPYCDTTDPHLDDRARLRAPVEMLFCGHGKEVAQGNLEEIAERWSTYAIDYFGDHIADLARKEHARRKEASEL